MNYRISKLLIVAATMTCGLRSAPLPAQNYRFQVEKMELQVHVQKDASARLEYTIVFNNAGDPIDIVDIGLPHDDYTIKNMSASVDDKPTARIAKSEYIDIGVEAHLGAHRIPRGKNGTFRFAATLPDMVYADTTDSTRASLQIRPTWFDPSLQVGNTKLTVLVHLPPGVQQGDTTWHSDDLPYEQLVLVGSGAAKHLVAMWSFPNHTLSASNPKIGISFPRRVMDRVVTIGPFGLLLRWFEQRPGVQFVSFVCVAALMAIAFFRFSGGTGVVVFLILAAALIFVVATSPAWHLVLWPTMIGATALGEWGRSRRQQKYLPALATVEGGGIKRGLTAPQAAVLLEAPLGRVLTLVVFGLLKKGILKQVAAEPLQVDVEKAFCTTRKRRRQVAADRGIVLHDYEHPFLDRLIQWEKPLAENDLSEAMGKMIRGVGGQMKGFDLSDTRAYYRQIVSRAWTEAETIGEIKQRDKAVDRNFEWMMMDPDYEGRFGRWGGGGYHYYPSWTRTSTAAPGGSSAPSAPSAPSSSQTGFGEVAASFAGWAENTTGSLASAVEPGGLGINTLSSGLMDLSGVDHVTGDIISALAESSGSGGGGGGGCACACAGCACACACAGGGR